MKLKLAIALAAAMLVGAVIGGAGFSSSPLNSIAAPSQPRASTFCSYTDTMDRYACLIDAAANGALTNASGLPIGASRAFAAMQTIQTLASSARYSYWQAESDSFTIPNSAEQHVCLDEGFGICGNHMLLFVDLMRRMNVPARRVEFFYADPESGQRLSHAAAEFELDGKWRFVDITWGSIWLADKTDIATWLSLDEAREGKGQRVSNDLAPWFLSRRTAGVDPFTYLAAGVDTVIEGDGVVGLPFERRGDEMVANFSSIPNYIGDNVDDGESRHIRLAIPETVDGELALEIAGAGACEHSQIGIGSSTAPIDKGTVILKATNGGVLETRGDDPACYVVLSAITLGSQPSS